MKFSHRSFPRLAILAAIFLPILVHAESTETPTEAIPWSEIGAKAGADYEGDGLSITPSADGAILNSIFQRLRGEATPEGLWLKSTAEESEGDRFRLVAGAYGRAGGEATPLPQMGRVETGEKLVSYFRPGLVEEYSTSMDGVRQDFLVLQRPPGFGELQVELALDGALAEAAGFGARLILEKSGRHIAYSRLHVVDAEGTELTARIEIAATDRLVISVDDTAAKYPVRIDPTFSDENWVSMDTGITDIFDKVNALAVDGSGTLYAGGRFTTVGGVMANRVARWDGSNWSALGTGLGSFSFVYALALDGSGNLYVGGDFTNAGGVTANGIARWDGNDWSALGAGLNGTVYALAVDANGNLYAGGDFSHVSGEVEINRMARWDGSNWSQMGGLGWGVVFALALDGSGNLYAGGAFTTAGGVAANRVALWNGSNWSPLGTGMNFTVNSLAVDDSGNLYAGGGFTSAGGVAANRIARWDGGSWSALGAGISTGVGVFALAHDSRGNLYAGGQFTFAGGFGANSIARWDGNNWSALGTGVDQRVYALALDSSGSLYVGGSFNTAGGRASARMAKWIGDASKIAVEAPTGTEVENTVGSLLFNVSSLGQNDDLSITIRNDQGVALTGIHATINGPDSANFELLTMPPTSLTSGESAEFSVRFAPTASWIKTASLSIISDSAVNSPFTVALSGLVGNNPPTDLTTSSDWLYDNVPVGTLVSYLMALDPNTEDIHTYTLVEGSGDADNSKFTITNNELRSAASFNYDSQRSLSIRVRVTDIGGLSLERILRLQLVDATPSARFEARGVFPTAPSYVNVAFQLTDLSGQGINIPRDLFDQVTDIFQVREEGTAISPTESFLQVGKLDEVPAVIRTVILLDNSASVGINLLKVREAASALVDQILPQQEMAIYSFSSQMTELQTFTRDKTALKAAINGMPLGAATTNLNGSMLEALGKWEESFDENGIETGFLVVFTDGADTSGAATTQAVLDKRNAENKRIFMIGLGNEIDSQVLNQMGNGGFLEIDNFNDLENAFAQVQQNIEDTANSFYWVNYASPRRGDFIRNLTISLKGNTYSGTGSVLSAQFSSNGFSDVERGVAINRSVDRTDGVASLAIAPDGTDVARAFTILPLVEDGAEFTWTLEDPSLVTLIPLEADNSRMRIVPNGRDGTTSLTVVDTVNSPWADLLGLSPTTFTRTITLVIGSGVSSGPDFATWAAAAGLTGDDALPNAMPFNDGVPNLLKFAFNMNLAGPDSHRMTPGGNSGLPGGGLVEENGQTYWRVEYVRRKNSGLNYTPQKSSTLGEGSFTTMTGAETVSEIPGEPDWERVIIDEPCDPASEDRCFSRVRVDLP